MLDRADIYRVSFDIEDGSCCSAFSVWFYTNEPAGQPVEVSLYILESTSVVEPKRSSYTLSIIDEEASELPDAGSIYQWDPFFRLRSASTIFLLNLRQVS